MKIMHNKFRTILKVVCSSNRAYHDDIGVFSVIAEGSSFVRLSHITEISRYEMHTMAAFEDRPDVPKSNFYKRDRQVSENFWTDTPIATVYLWK